MDSGSDLDLWKAPAFLRLLRLTSSCQDVVDKLRISCELRIHCKLQILIQTYSVNWYTELSTA